MAKTKKTSKKVPSKKVAGPTQDRHDPWNRDFDAFKAHHKTNNHETKNGRIPESSVFDISRILDTISGTNATKIAVYAMKHPNPVIPGKGQGLMVAVFFDNSLQVVATDPPYLPADHNCPTECLTDPFKFPKKAKPKPSTAKSKSRLSVKKVAKTTKRKPSPTKTRSPLTKKIAPVKR